MRKLILAGALAAFGAMNAQTERGSWVVSGSTGIGFNNMTTSAKSGGIKSEGEKVSTFTITPSVGYFVTDGLAIGLDLSYSAITTKYSNSKTTVSTFGILPSATYYFKTASAVIPYLGAGLGYANMGNKMTENGRTDDYSQSGLAWKAKGGLVYMITPSVGLDVGVGYSQFSSKYQPLYSQEMKMTIGTLSVNGGLSIFFGGQHHPRPLPPNP